MKNIYIDYDTTLVDFQDVMTQKINTIENTSFTPLQLSRGYFTEYKIRNKHIFTHENIYEDITPFDGAVDFLQKLTDLGYKPILVTANASEYQGKCKDIHIQKYFAGCFEDIIHAEDKYKYTKDSLLIDDSYENIINHINANDQIGVLFNFNYEYIITDKLDLEVDKLHHMSRFEDIFTLLDS